MAKKIPQIVREIKQFKPQEVNYAYQKNISYSQYSMWKKCPKQWSLQYRDGHKIYTQSIHTIFGSAFHETLQHYLTVMYEKSGAEADREDIFKFLKDKIIEHYTLGYKKNNNQHFSQPGELQEFYNDGVEILSYIKKKRGRYFTKRGWHLVGVETPITIAPNPKFPNILYIGFLDIVFYHEPTNTFKIIDIKTSTRSWGDYQKKDEEKQFQLIFYKKYFAEQFDVPLESISVEFLIVKRKIPKESDYPAALSRIQTISPPSGKVKLGKATKALDAFIEDVFTQEGYSDKKMEPNPSKWNCTFCAYCNDDKLCGLGKYEVA